MGLNEILAKRVEESLRGQRGITQKRMFGGLCFLHHGNMLCGIDNKGQLMVRVGSEQYEKALTMKHVKKMDFTGKPLKGMIYVKPGGIKSEKDIDKWVAMGLKFTGTLPRR